MLPFVKISEKPAREQLDHNVMRPLLHFPLVAVAGVSHAASDVADPVEATHSFQGLPMLRRRYGKFSHFVIKKLVVLCRVEAEIRLGQTGEKDNIG